LIHSIINQFDKTATVYTGEHNIEFTFLRLSSANHSHHLFVIEFLDHDYFRRGFAAIPAAGSSVVVELHPKIDFFFCGSLSVSLTRTE